MACALRQDEMMLYPTKARRLVNTISAIFFGFFIARSELLFHCSAKACANCFGFKDGWPLGIVLACLGSGLLSDLVGTR